MKPTLTILQAMGCVGVVTNGAVRDLDPVERLGFQLFSSTVSVSHAYAHVATVDSPVHLGGLEIMPGDLLHGDQHGIVKIPGDLAESVVQIASLLRGREKKILHFCQSPEFSVPDFASFCWRQIEIPMSRFSLRFPYFIIVACLMVCVVGVTTLVRMPVDLFPAIKIPVVVVATFFSGMPPEQIENDITGRFERFFTLGSGIDHMESRSLPGVSLIKVYFQPGTNADSAVTTISNLAMANLRRLPPGTLPPVVLKFDASSLPVCLVTLKGEGLNETQLRDLGQFAVRNQMASVPGASVPQPFGGRYRQIMVYVDPLKLEAHQLSVMDVVRTVNESNLILPAGDVKIGPFDYNIYTNSQLNTIEQINTAAEDGRRIARSWWATSARRRTAAQIQTNIVRVDGQFRLSAGAEAGRRRQYHRHRQRNQEGRGRPGRCAEIARHQCGLRPVGLRQNGHREPAARRRHRSGSHRADDHRLPRQLPRHGRGVPLDPAFRAGDLHCALLRG